MPKLRLSRKAALVGVSAAAATATVVAVAAPALAAPSQLTSCTETVRVRSQPSETAPVIGSCQAGERVTVDGTRNGFAHLVNKRGWASLDYVRLRDAADSNSDEESDFSDEDSTSDAETADFNTDRQRNDQLRSDRERDRDRDRNRDDNDDNNNDDNDDSGLGGLLGN